jgi:phosphotransferase system HPr-like phosphotransfer protein
MKVMLNKVSDVNRFVEVMMNLPIEADLVSGRYTIDAKSIMGIFSLDLSKPINVVFHGELSSEDYEAIKEFAVE